jgi:hypothetical protein
LRQTICAEIRAKEFAERKVLAPFDRAEARDFADVFALARRCGTDLVDRCSDSGGSETDRTFDLGGSRQRARVYEIVLREGSADRERP